MSDTYVPTMKNIEDCYVCSGENYDGSLRASERQLRAEFAAALAAHDAEVAAKAWDEGHDAGWNSRDDDAARGWMPSGVHESDAENPYRKAVQS